MSKSPLIKSAGRQFAIYGLGDLLSKAIAFVLLPVYTRYLSPRDYGTLEMLDLTVYLIGLFLAMGIPQAIMRFYYEYSDPQKKNEVVSSGLLASLIISATALAFLIPFSGSFSSLIFKTPQYSHLFTLIFITLGLNLLIDIPMAYFRIREMPIWFISFSTVRLFLSLGFNILFVVILGMGVNGVITGGLIASALIGSVLFVYLIRQVGRQFSWKIFLPMLRYGAPLIGNWMGMYLINFGDRFLLQHLLPPATSLASIGIYSLAYKFGMLPNFLILSPFIAYWGPKQFQIVREPGAPSVFSRVFNYYSFLQFFFGLGLCALIHDLIHIIAGPLYGPTSRYVPLIVLAYVCYGIYLFVQFGMLYRKKTHYMAINTMAMASLNVILNLIFIPLYGVMGSAIATLAAIFLMMGVAFFMAQRLYHIPYDYGRFLKMLALAVVLYLVASRVNPGNIAVSVILKTLIVLTYPLLLIPMGVWSGKELTTVRDFTGRFIPAFKAYPKG